MRIRTIKPEFWGHPILAKEPDDVRLAALGLLNISDDEGYFLAVPALVRSSLWPLDEDSSKARRTLARLEQIGYISTTNHPTHGPVGLVQNFAKHQRVDRPTSSKLKAYFDSTNARRTLDERSCPEQGTGNREQGTGNEGGAREEHDDQTTSEIPDQDRWPYERREPWAQSLVRAGAKIGRENWPAWKTLCDKHGPGVVANAAKSLPASDRWPDKTEEAITPTDPEPQSVAKEIREEYADHLKWVSLEKLGKVVDAYGEETVRKVCAIAQRHSIIFDADEWREAFLGRKSEYGGYDFWYPQPKLTKPEPKETT